MNFDVLNIDVNLIIHVSSFTAKKIKDEINATDVVSAYKNFYLTVPRYVAVNLSCIMLKNGPRTSMYNSEKWLDILCRYTIFQHYAWRVKGYYSLFWRSILTSLMESVFSSCIPLLNKNKRLLRSVLQRVRNLKSFKELTGKQLCRSLFLITLQAISSHHLLAQNQQ